MKKLYVFSIKSFQNIETEKTMIKKVMDEVEVVETPRLYKTNNGEYFPGRYNLSIQKTKVGKAFSKRTDNRLGVFHQVILTENDEEKANMLLKNLAEKELKMMEMRVIRQKYIINSINKEG